MSDDIPQARFNIEQLRFSLGKLKDTIKEEQQKAQREIFRNFLVDVLKMDLNDEGAKHLEEQYIQSLDVLSDDDIELKERISQFIESEFLYSILTYKNLSYEREIKSFLQRLTKLIQATSTESSESEMAYVTSFLSTGLKDVVSIIEGQDIPPDMVGVILESLSNPLDAWFGRR
tara:strand:- start:2501 stop:3022 length:522 start_codon:yes stop_codon:yes gene_type:complete